MTERIFWITVLIIDSGWVLLALSIYLARSGIYPR
jgi:hypothetical protein